MIECRKLTRIALCALSSVVLVLTGCTQSHSADSGPALKETTDWINDTYNRRGINSMELIKNGIYQTQDERTTSLHIDNCVATVEEKQTPGFILSSDVVLISDIQTFNLADIDLSHIKIEKTSSHDDGMACDNGTFPNMTCDQADIGLHVRNDRPLIGSKRVVECPKLKGVDHQKYQ